MKKTINQKKRSTDFTISLANEFEIIIPSDYDHDKEVNRFLEKFTKDFYRIEPEIKAELFKNASVKLKPGNTYLAKIFTVRVPYENIMGVEMKKVIAFLKKQELLLVGVRGLTLVYELKKNEFLKDNFVVSFEETVFDGKYSINPVLPCLQSLDSEYKNFTFGSSDFRMSGGSILCFCDPKP